MFLDVCIFHNFKSVEELIAKDLQIFVIFYNLRKSL